MGGPFLAERACEVAECDDGPLVSAIEQASTVEQAPGPEEACAREEPKEGCSRQERLAGLGSLVAGVAHEVNNPLTYLVGNLAELERYVGLVGDVLHAYRRAQPHGASGNSLELAVHTAEEKLSECGGLGMIDELVTDALHGALRVREIASQLLSLARPGVPDIRRVDVHALLESTLRLIRPSLPKHIAVELDLQSCGWVQSDPGRVGQILLNLVHNAVQACDPPELALHCIVLRTRDARCGMRIEVEDDGCGMSQLASERAFDPFFSTKDPCAGTGLGLSISRRLLGEIEGTLGFHPAATRGTVFVVELPARVPARSDVSGSMS